MSAAENRLTEAKARVERTATRTVAEAKRKEEEVWAAEAKTKEEEARAAAKTKEEEAAAGDEVREEDSPPRLLAKPLRPLRVGPLSRPPTNASGSSTPLDNAASFSSSVSSSTTGDSPKEALAAAGLAAEAEEERIESVLQSDRADGEEDGGGYPPRLLPKPSRPPSP